MPCSLAAGSVSRDCQAEAVPWLMVAPRTVGVLAKAGDIRQTELWGRECHRPTSQQAAQILRSPEFAVLMT